MKMMQWHLLISHNLRGTFVPYRFHCTRHQNPLHPKSICCRIPSNRIRGVSQKLAREP
ncbi:hypothetical protein X975_09545, partial [Stegodyphus mimosarum]